MLYSPCACYIHSPHSHPCLRKLPGARDGAELILVLVGECTACLDNQGCNRQCNHRCGCLTTHRAGENVVITWVFQVQLEAVDGAQATHCCLRAKAQECQLEEQRGICVERCRYLGTLWLVDTTQWLAYMIYTQHTMARRAFFTSLSCISGLAMPMGSNGKKKSTPDCVVHKGEGSCGFPTAVGWGMLYVAHLATHISSHLQHLPCRCASSHRNGMPRAPQTRQSQWQSGAPTHQRGGPPERQPPKTWADPRGR